jgi:DNA uptake protein ComE-like DNA-binding protein
MKRIAKSKNRNFLHAERGLSLIAVLWIVTILTVLATELLYSLHLEVKSSRNWNDQVNAYYAAKGGMETALANLRVDETGYDSLDEDWAKGFNGELNNSTFETKVIDESSLINVNTADEATIAKAIELCLNNQQTDEQLSEMEITTKAQELAAAIIAARPYRTPSEMAKAEGMTPEVLYGYTGESKYLGESTKNTGSTDNTDNTDQTGNNQNQQVITALIDATTVYSVDKNISSDGRKRVNINTADANAIQQGVNPQGQGQQQVITQQEAQAIVDYRTQASQNSNQTGQTQVGQATQTPSGQADQTGQTQGGTGTQNAYKGIADLLNVPAISQQTFDAIKGNITVDDQSNQGNQQQGNQKVNINSADASQIQGLGNNIDAGIADSIVKYRQNNRFDNIDEIKEVKAITIQDLKAIIDNVTLTDDVAVKGKININTISSELLSILPGMDEQKAQTIIAYREIGTNQGTGTVKQANQQGGPLENVGQLLDVQGIDENTFRQLIDQITYRTATFRIKSTGKSMDGKIVSDFTAIIDRSGDTIKTRYWKQL